MWWNWWLQRGNHCSADEAIQQPSLDRQGAVSYCLYTRSLLGGGTINYETLGFWAEYLSPTEQWLWSKLSAYPEMGGGEGLAGISADSGTWVVFEFLYFLPSFFLKSPHRNFSTSGRTCRNIDQHCICHTVYAFLPVLTFNKDYFPKHHLPIGFFFNEHGRIAMLIT